LRSVVFRFEDITAFSLALGDARGSLALPGGETVADGEWVLATFEIGSRRRATAAAARCVRAAGDTHLAFERRDWDRLLAFVAARSEHMRAARPVTATSSSRIPAAEPLPPSSPDPEDTSPFSRASISVDDTSPFSRSSVSVDSEMPPSSIRVPLVARVLLVDEDASTRDEVRGMLTQIGLLVEAVESADAAHARMRETTFDALVLDFHGATLEPLEFVRGLRRDPLLVPLPVLIISHSPSSRDVVDAFASGADDFLPKPFRAPELGARIFGLLRRARLARLGSVAPGAGPRSSRGGGGLP
jgi:two-component system phosphate regulon response regulator PhoB